MCLAGTWEDGASGMVRRPLGRSGTSRNPNFPLRFLVSAQFRDENRDRTSCKKEGCGADLPNTVCYECGREVGPLASPMEGERQICQAEFECGVY